MSKRSSDTVELMDASALREAGRAPATPFRVALSDGGELVVHRLLRVLPGKRIVGQGLWNGRCVLAKLFVASGSARHWAQEKAGIEALQAETVLVARRVDERQHLRGDVEFAVAPVQFDRLARIEFQGPEAQAVEVRQALGQVLPQAEPGACGRSTAR